MNKSKLVCLSLMMATATAADAGGILTNTNQSITFLRNPARDAAIGIDGVYSNPAGVAFMSNGLHLSFNIQNAHQTRTITSTFAPLAFGANNNGNTTKVFKGNADAPIIPSIQAAYNKNDWSFQFNFALTGGGGKCVFNNGLSSFEGTISLLPLLSQNLDALSTQLGLGELGLPTVSQYDMDTYMRGRQYYFGFTLGAAKKINEHWSAYVGARVLYGTANYYGYVKNIKANIDGQMVNAPETFKQSASEAMTAVGTFTELAKVYQQQGDATNAAKYAALAKEYTIKGTMLGALGSATEDVTLNCDQSGWGVAPIIGVDYKTGNFNFAAKYEFKTRMRLKNRSANSESAKNLELLDRYEDGIEVAEDSPALLTLGAQWSPLPQLRVSAGWHHYFDKDAHQFNHHEKKLGGDTDEYLVGAEYDITKAVQVSAGFQKTNYEFTGDYMEDISFNVSSYSFGFGVGVKVSKKMKLNVAYFQTNYSDFNRETQNYYNIAGLAGKIVGNVATQLQGAEAAEVAVSKTVAILTTPNAETGMSMLYGKDKFTRTNRVLGIGLDIDF